MNKTKLTIGIPAFNEELNICDIIADINMQKLTCCDLEKIIIVSDGSEDSTVAKVTSLNQPNIELVDSKERLGIAKRLNQLCSLSDSEILIIFNADIRLSDEHVVEKLAQPVIEGFDLVSGKLQETTPTTFIEKVLYQGSQIKRDVYTTFRDGDNNFNCHGPLRAFSKRLYKSIQFDYSPAEDLFSYLYCKQNGYKFFYVPSAVVYYTLHKNFKDHFKQSKRFFGSGSHLRKNIAEEVIKNETSLPKSRFVKSLLVNFIKAPVLTVSYVLLTFFVVVKLKSMGPPELKEQWDVSSSSKEIKA